MSAPVAATPATTNEAAPPSASHTSARVKNADGVGERRTLDHVPPPGTDSGLTGAARIVPLAGFEAGGLDAVWAQWGAAGGDVLLVGQRPFAEVSAQAAFDDTGALSGHVDMLAAISLMGLPVATATWRVAGWAPPSRLASPTVTVSGATLDVDLTAVEADVTVEVLPAFQSHRTDNGLAVQLPHDALGDVALPDGLGLTPRIAELLGGLLGMEVADVTALRADLAEATPAAPRGKRADTEVVGANIPPEQGPTASPHRAPPEQPRGQGAAPPSAGAATEFVEAEAERAAPPPTAELLMPPAPSHLTPAASARAATVTAGARNSASAATDLPSAEETVDDARGAVTEPAAETAARAREDLTAALGERAAPSPEIVELCARIRVAIHEQRPVDEDELTSADPSAAAQAAGSTVSTSVEGQVTQVEDSYSSLANPPVGTPELTPTPVVAPTSAVPAMGPAAASAAPDPIAAQDLSLDADVAATDARIAESGIDTRVTREIPDGDFAAAREASGELEQLAEQTPAELAAEQSAAIQSAQADMATLQRQAVAALREARGGTVHDVSDGSSAAVQSEEQTREAVSLRAQAIFDTAQTRVTTMLDPLTHTAMANWNAGLARLSQEFRDALAQVQRWIDERHAGVGGFVTGLGDAVFGLPSWVIRAYNDAEREFGDGICDLLLAISRDVNSVVAAAQATISQARDDIDAAFTAMEAEFPEWAARERTRFSGMLDGLQRQATDAQTGFVRDVSRAALDAVAQTQAAVEAHRDAARGVLGRVVAAIEGFIDDPVTAIIDGLLRLVGIPPADFWALVARIQEVAADIADDPENFINNMTAGVRQGFEQFFDGFGTHVLSGLWTWLFSGLNTPIPLPRDFSAASLFNFALQLMGITWPRVREILVEHIGAENVELIEAAWELVTLLMERGPEGIVEMLREALDPEDLVQVILEAAVEYLVETLIQQVVVRVVGMLNPVGAVAQAIDMIYQVCAWIFRNAARIFRFVEAIVNGMADVIAGNIGGLANAVEQALASLIPPVIDFLAGLMHLSGLPDEVAAVIARLQGEVYAVMDQIIGALAERGRALLESLGLGSEDDDAGDSVTDDELGTTVRFSAEHESHRLWVDVAGSQATVMMASTPTPLEAKIASWGDQVANQNPASTPAPANPMTPATHAAASADLNALVAALAQADVLADQLAPSYSAAQQGTSDGQEPPSDTALVSQQRRISELIRSLLQHFGEEGGREAYLLDISAQLPIHARVLRDAFYAHLAPRVERVKLLNDGNDSSLWPGGVPASTAAASTAYVNSAATHELLLPYFENAPGERSAHTSAFRAYALVSEESHGVRDTFRESYGNAIRDVLIQQATTRLTGEAQIHPKDRQERLAQINAITFDASGRGGGSLSLPNDRAPEHYRYMPQDISTTESGGTRITTYRTETGQTFKASTTVNELLTYSDQTILGKNLRKMKIGRGVTQTPAGFVMGEGFHRSHLIADMFGGSGASDSQNVIMASPRYNIAEMGGMESRIREVVVPKDNGVEVDEGQYVHFDMTVSAKLGSVPDLDLLAALKEQIMDTSQKYDLERDVQDRIIANINANEPEEDLIRAVQVDYDWTFLAPAKGHDKDFIGQDVWLYLNGG